MNMYNANKTYINTIHMINETVKILGFAFLSVMTPKMNPGVLIRHSNAIYFISQWYAIKYYTGA